MTDQKLRRILHSIILRARLVFSASLLLTASVAVSAANTLKLNAPLPVAANVVKHQISADGGTVVYVVQQSLPAIEDYSERLYSVPLDGSLPAVKLDALPAGEATKIVHKISADGSRVVFVVRANSAVYSNEIYSVLIDGSAPPVKLNPVLVAGGDVAGADFQISPDGSTVVYQADQDTDNIHELYSVPIDGSALAVKLNPPLVANGDIGYPAIHQISADSSTVVYSADQDSDNIYELYSVPIDGSLPAVKLNAPLASSNNSGLQAFLLSPDGSTVFYVADQDVSNSYELYSVPIDGSLAPQKLSGGPYAAPVRARKVQLSADGHRVLYELLIDQPAVPNKLRALYSVVADGSAAPMLLNTSLLSSSDLQFSKLSSDGNRAVFAASPTGSGKGTELYSTQTNGSSAPLKITPVLTPGSWGVENTGNHLQLTPDGSRAIYLADHDYSGNYELYSVPTDGSAATIRLNPPLGSSGGVLGFLISPNGDYVAYQAKHSALSQTELFRIRVDGSGVLYRVNDPLPPNGAMLWPFYFSPDSSAITYIARQDNATVFELYVRSQFCQFCNPVPQPGSFLSNPKLIWPERQWPWHRDPGPLLAPGGGLDIDRQVIINPSNTIRGLK